MSTAVLNGTTGGAMLAITGSAKPYCVTFVFYPNVHCATPLLTSVVTRPSVVPFPIVQVPTIDVAFFAQASDCAWDTDGLFDLPTSCMTSGQSYDVATLQLVP